MALRPAKPYMQPYWLTPVMGKALDQQASGLRAGGIALALKGKPCQQCGLWQFRPSYLASKHAQECGPISWVEVANLVTH